MSQDQQQTPPPETKPVEANPLSETIRSRLMGMVTPDPSTETPAPTTEKKEATPATPTTPVTQAAGDPPAEKPKKKSTPPSKIIQAPEPSMGEMVTQAATAAATAAIKATQPAPSPKVEAPTPELPDDIAEDLAAYKAMEEMSPKYRGLADKVVEFSKKGGIEEQYINQWKKANPGKEFDSDDEDHEDFYATKAPDFSETDLKKATKQVLKRELQEDMDRRITPKLEEQRVQQIAKEVEPVLAQTSYNLTATALGVLGDDLLKIAAEKGDAGLEEADPLALQVVGEVLPQYEAMAHEVVRVFSGVSKVAEKPSQLHSQINDLALKLDHAVSQVEPEHRWKPVVRNGKVVGHQQFASFAEYQKMSPEQREQHWIIGQDEVVAHIGSLARGAVKGRYDKLMASAQRTIGAKSGQKTATTPATVTPTVAATPVAKPSSPSFGSASPTPTPKGGEANDTARPGSRFARAWGGVR